MLQVHFNDQSFFFIKTFVIAFILGYFFSRYSSIALPNHVSERDVSNVILEFGLGYSNCSTRSIKWFDVEMRSKVSPFIVGALVLLLV